MQIRPLHKLLCAALGLGISLSASAADPLKVGFVYIGPIGDHGWTYQHEQGRKALAEKFGNQITTNYVENVAEGADAERVIRNMAKLRLGHGALRAESRADLDRQRLGAALYSGDAERDRSQLETSGLLGRAEGRHG